MSEYGHSYVPPNVGDGGKVFGLFKKRNAIETGILLALDYLVYKMVLFRLPGLSGLFIAFGIGLLLFILGMAGIDSEPLSLFVMSIFTHAKSKAIVTLKMPEKEKPVEVKKSRFKRMRRTKKDEGVTLDDEVLDAKYEG